MIRLAPEGSTTWFDTITGLDLPHPLHSGITLHLRGTEIGIEAQGVVGAIPLRNGDTLQITPKIGRVNFLRLLFRAEGMQHDLEYEYEEFVQYGVDDEANIDSIVAKSLFVSLIEILRRSLRQNRIQRRRTGSFALGQMEPISTALKLACREREPVVYFIKEKTPDTPENRILREASVRAWSMLNERDRALFQPIRDRWSALVPRIGDVAQDLEWIERGFSQGYYGGPRDYYRKALMLSQIVLGSYGLGLSEAATIEGDAVLLNTATIFEKYLRSVISESYAGAGYIVSKGGVGVRSLYTNGSFELQPDIVVSRGGWVLLIADAKYKQPTAGDHYQMNTYLAANSVRRGLILAPLFDGNDVQVKEYTTDGKTVVREAYLPMANLRATEDFLSKVLDQAA